MPIYHKLGEIPDKRHIQFRKPNGDLYYEQLFGTIGFDGMSSLMYQHYRPTMVTELKESIDVLFNRHMTKRVNVNLNLIEDSRFSCIFCTLLDLFFRNRRWEAIKIRRMLLPIRPAWRGGSLRTSWSIPGRPPQVGRSREYPRLRQASRPAVSGFHRKSTCL